MPQNHRTFCKCNNIDDEFHFFFHCERNVVFEKEVTQLSEIKIKDSESSTFSAYSKSLLLFQVFSKTGDRGNLRLINLLLKFVVFLYMLIVCFVTRCLIRLYDNAIVYFVNWLINVYICLFVYFHTSSVYST
jgi:hypothetical protein